jgi:hypothetical protein
MQGQTKIQERLRGIQGLIHEIEEARNTSENTINKISQSSSSNNSKLIKEALLDTEKEEQLIRRTLSKIYEVFVDYT